MGQLLNPLTMPPCPVHRRALGSVVLTPDPGERQAAPASSCTSAKLNVSGQL